MIQAILIGGPQHLSTVALPTIDDYYVAIASQQDLRESLRGGDHMPTYFGPTIRTGCYRRIMRPQVPHDEWGFLVHDTAIYVWEGAR